MIDYWKEVNSPTCNYCGLSRTPEGYDGCLGELENVMNACCGHGHVEKAYVQFDHVDYKEFPNQNRISGIQAIEYIKSIQ